MHGLLVEEETAALVECRQQEEHRHHREALGGIDEVVGMVEIVGQVDGR